MTSRRIPIRPTCPSFYRPYLSEQKYVRGITRAAV
jgi:hypothetical protein